MRYTGARPGWPEPSACPWFFISPPETRVCGKGHLTINKRLPAIRPGEFDRLPDRLMATAYSGDRYSGDSILNSVPQVFLGQYT